ncbi:hypothetical protein, partial [Pseudomonas viridiflava]|uniref:hypothetical protein n=1 Tax=Pseudomonas viridiflava TaxID=33069 RepID=UPI00197F8121
QHFHADHPVFSCSKSEQKQLNTWVSFQSAEQRLLGQFSVSGNTRKRALPRRPPHNNRDLRSSERLDGSLIMGIDRIRRKGYRLDIHSI